MTAARDTASPAWGGMGWGVSGEDTFPSMEMGNWLTLAPGLRWNCWALTSGAPPELSVSQQPSILQAYLWPRVDAEIVQTLPWRQSSWDVDLWSLALSQAARCGRSSAFELGARMLPGPCGAASQLLANAPDGLTALQLLCIASARLSPLLTPRLLVTSGRAWLWWMPSCRIPPALKAWLADFHHAALKSLLTQRAGTGCDGTWHFARTAPSDLSVCWSHLGQGLRHGCQADAASFPISAITRPGLMPLDRQRWLAQEALPMLAMTDPEALRRPMLSRLHDWLFVHIDQSPSLEHCAQAFGISPATLKRQLQALDTHFRAEWDNVRAHACAFLLSQPSWHAARVSATLGIHDASHFRRSVRRWTGLLPSALVHSA